MLLKEKKTESLVNRYLPDITNQQTLKLWCAVVYDTAVSS